MVKGNEDDHIPFLAVLRIVIQKETLTEKAGNCLLLILANKTC